MRFGNLCTTTDGQIGDLCTTIDGQICLSVVVHKSPNFMLSLSMCGYVMYTMHKGLAWVGMVDTQIKCLEAKIRIPFSHHFRVACI